MSYQPGCQSDCQLYQFCQSYQSVSVSVESVSLSVRQSDVGLSVSLSVISVSLSVIAFSHLFLFFNHPHQSWIHYIHYSALISWCGDSGLQALLSQKKWAEGRQPKTFALGKVRERASTVYSLYEAITSLWRRVMHAQLWNCCPIKAPWLHFLLISISHND